MKVLVDTCVWSLSLRRKKVVDDPYVRELKKLIKEYRAQMLEPIRQEVLSGIRAQEQFEKLQMHLRAFPDLPVATRDYERAAEFFNTCRRKGIQESNTDFLLCAVGERHEMPIFTFDDDFKFLADCLPITLHSTG
jgi:predicted nucleic acid-binding protein